MSVLSMADFVPFFEAINQAAPFPWQVRLVNHLAEHGTWPEVIALPTGAGKTCALEIAIFHLALEAANGVRRRAPVRIAFVVDRRLIVDNAYKHAQKHIRRALLEPTHHAVQRVSDALVSLSGDRRNPLHVARLRGGMPREGDWTPSPSHPTIVCSTVDQVGSRLLFRGYGVSESMRPVHAGLLGDDTLILLDEVHLSEPFRQTLNAVQSQRRAERAPWAFVQLSATPHDSVKAPFALDSADRANPILQRRLRATKRARIELVRTDVMDERAEQFAQRAFELSALHAKDGVRRVLVVVNRVDFARAIHSKLQKLLDESAATSGGATALLLVGRSREIDKEGVREEVLSHTAARRKPDDPTSPPPCFFLVATQTVEAGADLDFEALVTQIAPLDALRQRFGRLDRIGRSGDVKAVILGAESDVARRADADPIYGEGLRATWEWLRQHAVADEMDFGIEALDRVLEGIPKEELLGLLSSTENAPILLPAYLDVLCRTRPTPNADPSIALFLHGPGPNVGEVSFVWRADIPLRIDRAHADAIGSMLSMIPPRASEALGLPLRAARAWLSGQRVTNDVSDIEGGGAGEDDDTGSDQFVAWRWRPVNLEVEAVRAAQLQPGDIAIVPTARGGCDNFGWNPNARKQVTDVAGKAQQAYSARSFAIRLHPAILLQQFADDEAHSDSSEEQRERGASRLFTRISEQVGIFESIGGTNVDEGLVAPLLARSDLPSSLRTELLVAHDALTEGDARKAVVVQAYRFSEGDETTPSRIIYFPHGLGTSKLEDELELESTTEDDARGSSADRSVALDKHSDDVRRLALAFASRAALDEGIAHDVALAGWLHDHGKADVRFQRYLSGGRVFVSTELLAKSGRTRSRQEDRRAWLAAGLPPQWRHEACSVAVALRHPRFAEAKDPELVLWLIGTHHGWGRPLFPHTDPLEGSSRSVAVSPREPAIDLSDSVGPQSPQFALSLPVEGGLRRVDWCEMFERLTRRYGWWGLARLEAIVRLADHRASKAAERRGEARRG